MRRKSPNCQKYSTAFAIDSLIAPKTRLKTYTPFDVFKAEHPDKPYGVMTPGGKSDIAQWTREARKRFDALPQEEKERLTAVAKERTLVEREAAEAEPSALTEALCVSSRCRTDAVADVCAGWPRRFLLTCRRVGTLTPSALDGRALPSRAAWTRTGRSSITYGTSSFALMITLLIRS